jgi:hypothetical protein
VEEAVVVAEAVEEAAEVAASGDYRIANLMSNHGTDDTSDHAATRAAGGLFLGIRMRLVEILDSNPGARARERPDYAAHRAAGAPLPRRWRLSGASGDRHHEAKGDGGYQVTAWCRFRFQSKHRAKLYPSAISTGRKFG